MNSLNKIEELENVINKVISMSWKDASFKEELIENPIETIEKHTGNKIVLSDDNALKFEDQTNPNIVYLNIPRKRDKANYQDDLELTDEQLESVSGGEWVIIGTIAAVITVCYLANDIKNGADMYNEEQEQN